MRVFVPILLILLTLTTPAFATTMSSPTVGADECKSKQTYNVTKLTDSNEPGTLRHALHVKNWGKKARDKKSCRNIQFAVGGNIELNAPIRVRSSFVTIDGCSAPAPGITITQARAERQRNAIIVDGTRGYTHDIVFKCLRFKGRHIEAPTHQVGSSLFVVDADCTAIKCNGAWKVADGGVANLVLEKIIFTESRDKLTIWGKVKNLLIKESFFYHNPLALLLSYYAGPYDLQRENIVLSNNLFALNNERNPQIRGWTDGLHIRNNIIANWDAYPPLAAELAAIGDGYGIRLKNEPGERRINANIINNVFIPGEHHPAKRRAIIYGWVPGPDQQDGGLETCLPQGQRFDNSNMGNLWVNGNRLPPENCDHYATVSSAIERPDWDKEPILATGEVCAHTLSQTKPAFPTETERAILAGIRAACEA